ncbi:MAG: hypothetical protein OXL34_17400 [Gemmatimonadota bacterium]|nr:hypothetical protein [Gemmatimonadota bacterium]
MTWSPDGSRVVYVDRWPPRHGVWTLDPATGQESRIVDPGNARVDYPRSLSDGTVTALRYAGADTAWVSYAPGPGHATVLADRAGGWTAPVRSPDGRSVAYLRAAGGRAALAVTEIETGETRTLADGLRLGWDRRVEWSPTGTALYLAAAGADDSLFVGWRVPLDGAPAERLARGGRDVLAVTPFADGRVALSVYHTRTAVGLVPATGGEPTDVTAAGSTSAFLPSWHRSGGLNHGRKSCKLLQGCTICVSCRCIGPCWTEPGERGSQPSMAGTSAPAPPLNHPNRSGFPRGPALSRSRMGAPPSAPPNPLGNGCRGFVSRRAVPALCNPLPDPFVHLFLDPADGTPAPALSVTLR